jgi:outer membrane cobalamin receptor
VNFGIGYHSNDARAVFVGPTAPILPEALGTEVGVRTWVGDRVELALDWWYLSLGDEFVFVGDAGTTESAGATTRNGVELVAAIWPLEWLYVRGDVAYTSARTDADDLPVPQSPRFVARAATGVVYGGFSAELAVRHLGDRYASETFYEPALSGYTVLDLGVRYRWRFLELGLALENLTDTDWRSSEFYYESQPIPTSLGGAPAPGFHFTPGNPINARVWLTGYF